MVCVREDLAWHGPTNVWQCTPCW